MFFSGTENNSVTVVLASQQHTLRSRRPYCTWRSSLTGTWEISELPVLQGRLVGVCRNTNMNGTEKSDSAVVPVKLANEGDKTLEESVEERALTKGNTPQPITCRTQGRVWVSAGLEGVRKAAGMHKDRKFTALLHHVTFDRLRDS